MSVVIGLGQHFIGCGLTITTNVSLTNDNNWLTVGPTTVGTGVTVTINNGAIWYVL